MNEIFSAISGIFKKDKKITEKKNINRAIVIVIILGIVLIFVSNFFPSGDNKNNSGTEPSLSVPLSEDEYIAQTEKKVEEILSKIQGAGKVSVMITLEGGKEKDIAYDIKENTEEKRSSDGESVESIKTSRETDTIKLRRESGMEDALIIKELNPKIKGVIVVAEGGSNSEVKLQLYEAVKTILGAAPHKVQVFAK